MKEIRPATGPPLTEARLHALLTLLGDEDPAVEQEARSRIKSGGIAAIELLRRRRLHPDPVIRRRLQALIDAHDADAADAEFSSFILNQGENLNLEEAVWLFSRTAYPQERAEAWSALFDDFARRIGERLAPEARGAAVLHEMNRLLFEELGLRGNQSDFYNPENSYPHRVLERRLGIPISLSLIYLFVGRRLGLPITGIGMPGHFLCRYQGPLDEFYVDAFHGGRFLTRSDCKQRLQTLAVAYDESHLMPVSPRRILHRVIANLHVIHKERRDDSVANRLWRYLETISGVRA